MDLSLTNYQSWSSAQLKVEGLTVVVGPSNLGKSALGRAFTGLVRNDILPDHIKIGTEGVRVEAIIGEHVVIASRGAKAKDSTVYNVDGQEFAKLGGDVPQVVKDMSFGPVEVNGVTIDPVFAGQFDGQFLIGESPANLNAVLNAFASTEKLDRGRKELARRTTETNATAKALVPQISALEEQSADLEATLTAAEAAHERAVAAALEVTRLDKAVAACGALLDASEKLRDLQHQIIRLSTTLNARDEAIKLYKGAARATLVLTSQEALKTLQAQSTQISAALGFLQPAATAYKASKALGDYVGSRTAAEAAKTLAGKIQEALAFLPPATAVYRQLKAVQTLRECREAVTQTGRRLFVLEDVALQLKPCLVNYKALVRVKALLTSNPGEQRALAQKVQDLPVAPAEKFLLAGIIIKKLLGLGQSAETTRGALDALAHENLLLDEEVEKINAQIDRAREAGTIVTCPKCSHEFSTAHAH